MEEVESYPVLSDVAPGELRARLPAAPPTEGEPLERWLADVDELIMPGITHWQSPNFYAFFSANASGPAILGELLSAGLGVQGMLWATSPACTELETHMLDWLVAMLELPRRFLSSSSGGGVIQDTASSAALCALLAARERVTAGDGNRQGLGTRLTAYTSSQAHSSIEKAAGIAGIGRDNLRLLPVDEAYAMRAPVLAETIAADRAAGATPFFVCATLGTTSSHAFDPLPEIAAICRREGLWLHVDAAHAGTAALCPEHRGMHDGLEDADSYCFNPHKWMLTNFDCDCFWVADRKSLVDALSVLPEYLRNTATESGKVIDYRDWQVPLGRRFRALKLWFVIRHYGVQGLQAHVRRHVAAAAWFAERVGTSERLELAAPPRLNLVCFRHRDGDEASERLLERLNGSGRMYLSHTRLAGRYALRMAIGATTTRQQHVEQAWALVRELAEQD